MTKEDIQAIVKEYIQENLTVEIDTSMDYGSEYMNITVMLDGKTISSSSVCIKSNDYYPPCIL